MKKIFALLIGTFLFAINLPKEFSADFKQIIYSNKSQLKYEGKIFYKNNQIVWTYLKPYKKTIWVKDKIYVYEPDLMQVTIINKKNENLVNLIKKSKKIKNNLFSTTFNGIKYYFMLEGKKVKYPKEIEYTDKFGNKVVIKFFNISQKTDPKVFKLNFPRDVDIINQE